jgi:uncharacterized protein (TIGR00255 family)
MTIRTVNGGTSDAASRPFRSMTGFGRSEAGANAPCVAEIKAVNARFLDVRVRLPPVLAASEARVQELVRGKVQRGSVDVTVRFRAASTTTGPWPLSVDVAAAQEIAKRCEELSSILGTPIVPTAEFLWTTGRVFVQHEADADASLLAAMELAVQQALDAMVTARTAEGARLKVALEAELERMGELVRTIGTLAAAQPARAKERLEERLARWGADFRDQADAQRLELELALFADRCDVSEELVRLEAHLSAFRDQLASGGAVGRRLDFLTQELHRETNTLATKAATVELSSAVVDLKASVERLREQVQNVE